MAYFQGFTRDHATLTGTGLCRRPVISYRFEERDQGPIPLYSRRTGWNPVGCRPVTSLDEMHLIQ